MTPLWRRSLSLLAISMPLLLYLAIFGTFASLSPRFRTLENAGNILVQSSSTAIVATGMTFVLLTAGIDLSVGAVMFVAAAFAGKLALSGLPVAAAAVAMIGIGIACGAVNALFISRLRLAPFIVTLAMLFVWRGAALWIGKTRAMNLPDEFREWAIARLFGIPAPVLVAAVAVAAAHVVLTRTPFGRQIYAVGYDPRAARNAGVNVAATLASVYIICSAFAALGGLVSLAQLSTVSPTFGRDRELEAIAAAVLGGVSLFGGRGAAFPGAVLGALMIHTVYNGLNVIDADPYIYPIITGAIIYLAVLLDGFRGRLGRARAGRLVAARPAETSQ